MATYSSKKYPAGSVTSATLADGTIVAVDLANDAVTSAKIQDAAITNAKLAADGFDASKFTTGTLPIARVADGAVTAGKLASTLDLTGKTVTLPAGVGGKVLQIVSQTFGTDFQSSTYGWLDLGLSATITPSSASNKILIIANVNIQNISNGNSSGGMGWRVANSSGTVIIDSPGDTNPFDFGQYLTVGWYNQNTNQTKHLLHSPNTTSAYTYKVQINRGTMGDPPRFNYKGGAANFSPVCVLTLMEIAA